MPSADGPDDSDSTDEEPEVLPGSTTKPRDIKHRTFESEEDDEGEISHASSSILSLTYF